MISIRLKSRFVRLCIVVVVPLLLFGGWLASSELLLPHHNVTRCTEQVDGFSCVSYAATAEQSYYERSDASVIFMGFVSLSTGFRHRVVFYEVPKNYSGLIDKSILQRTSEQVLTLPLPGVRSWFLDRWHGSCNVEPALEGLWHYYCSNHAGGYFAFSDELVEKRFRILVRDILRVNEQNSRNELTAKSVSIVSPFLVFLLMSLVVWVLWRAIKFVLGSTVDDTK